MHDLIQEKVATLAAAWHAKALHIDGLAAEIDRDRDLVEALKDTTLPIALGDDFRFWQDWLFAAGYVRDQILLVLADGRAVVEINGKAIGHRTFLPDDPQVVTTDNTGKEVRFQYGADLPESVYVEGDAVFLDFTGRMPAHLHVAGNLSVDHAAANMLPTGTLVGNDLHVFEFLSDVGPIRFPDGLRVNGDVHLPETSEVAFGNRTNIWGEILDGSESSLADRPVPSTSPEISRFAKEMETHVRHGWVYGQMPGWLSKTHSDDGQAFVIDEGEFQGWVLAISDGQVLGLNPHRWCRGIAALHLADVSSVEEVARRLDQVNEFQSHHWLGGIHEVLDLSDLPMELPEGFDIRQGRSRQKGRGHVPLRRVVRGRIGRRLRRHHVGRAWPGGPSPLL